MECLPGTRRNGIPAESLFADEAQIERWCLLMLDLGVINKQHHSFSTTTIVHNAYPPRPPPSPTTTNHVAEEPDTAHDEHRTPQESKNDAAMPRHHAQLANEHLQDGKTECHVADSDVATKRRMSMSVVVRHFRLSKYLPPIPVTL